MKKSTVLAVVVVAVLMLAFAGTASATEDSWRFVLRADNGAGLSPSAGAQLGVYTTASDGYNSSASDDGTPYAGIRADSPRTATHVAAIIPGVSDIYMKNIQSPSIPAPMKIWDVCIAVNCDSTSTVIRPLIYEMSSTTLPPTTVSGIPVRYYLLMLDNKGKAGAPANGTRWDLPIPTVADVMNPFWTCPVNLPVIKMSLPVESALIDEGYRLRLVQEVVPEPASILGLGCGVIGLLGMIRRHRGW